MSNLKNKKKPQNPAGIPRSKISLTEKAELIMAMDKAMSEGTSRRDLGKDLGRPRTTLNTIYDNKEKILQRLSQNPDTTSTVIIRVSLGSE